MNSRNKILFLLLCVLTFGLAGCSDDSSDGPLAAGINLSSASQQVSELGDSFKVTVNASGPWRSTYDSWLSVQPENGGAGEHTVIVTVKPQSEDEEAAGKVTFALADGSDAKDLTVMRGVPVVGRKTDSLALVALYNATNGPKWKVQWNFKLPVYAWEEVQMEERDGQMRVTQVMLKDFGLKGSIPDAIKYMDKLIYFSVENNAISGTFPEFLCDMKQLQLITLAGNNFSGEIPSKVFDLPELEYLILYGNNFSGQLPQNVGNCTSLKTLFLQQNGLGGEVPVSFANLKNLRYVAFNDNRFYGGLPDISAMDSLIGVDFSRNGEFTDEALTMPDGRSIDSRKYVKGGFTGQSPHVKNKVNLENFWIFENNLSSSPKFTNCPKLDEVRLNNNPMGSIDASVVTDMENLVSLYINDCNLTQLPEFTNCPKLKFLVAYNNQITGLPESISELTGMEEALLHNNKITSVPDGISEWSVVRHVNLAYNKLQSVPDAIWVLPVYALSLQCNEISQELPETFVPARNLSTLYLDMNKFHGSTKALATIARGQDIQCSINEFSGDLPVGFGRMTALRILTLDDNDITGSIPEDIKNCKSLETFYLKGNRMSGVVPASIVSIWNKWAPQTYILPQQDGYELTVAQ